jgi:hypothetical protein
MCRSLRVVVRSALPPIAEPTPQIALVILGKQRFRPKSRAATPFMPRRAAHGERRSASRPLVWRSSSSDPVEGKAVCWRSGIPFTEIAAGARVAVAAGGLHRVAGDSRCGRRGAFPGWPGHRIERAPRSRQSRNRQPPAVSPPSRRSGVGRATA